MNEENESVVDDAGSGSSNGLLAGAERRTATQRSVTGSTAPIGRDCALNLLIGKWCAESVRHERAAKAWNSTDTLSRANKALADVYRSCATELAEALRTVSEGTPQRGGASRPANDLTQPRG